MTINLVPKHRALLVPPVDMPMKLRISRGLWGINRTRAEVSVSKGHGTYTYKPVQNHEGVDLLGKEGDAVYAARTGEVVQVESIDGPKNKKVVIRHIEPGGYSFVTRYLHLKLVTVAVGATVSQGHCIGYIGPGSTPHLHFEIRLIMNSTNPCKDWYHENTELIDPTPLLYIWEKIYFEEIKDNTPATNNTPGLLQEVGMIRYDGVPFFQVKYKNKFYVIPLYCPDPGEEELVKLLERAYFEQKPVRLAKRKSYFFDVYNDNIKGVITAARVVE